MSERRHPRVVNVDEVEPRTIEKGRRFAAKMRSLGGNTGGKGLGCSHFEVPPGKTAFPHHFHCVLDEAIYVIEGEGTLRIGDERVAVRAGDYVSLPPGPDTAHQLINSGAGPLRYLGISTATTVEVVGYPDSKKVAARASESPAKAREGKWWVSHILRPGESLDYYDGEETE